MRRDVSVLLLLALVDEGNQDLDQVQLAFEVVHQLNEILDSGSVVFKDAIEVGKTVEDQLVVSAESILEHLSESSDH